MAARERRFHLDFLQESYEQGQATAHSEDVLTVLDARGLEVPESIRDLITGCTDGDRLNVWLRRAAIARTVDDLFDMPDAA